MFNFPNFIFIFIFVFIAINDVNIINSELQQECIFTNYSQINFTSIRYDCLNVVIDNLLVPAGKGLPFKLRNGAALTFRGNTSFTFSNTVFEKTTYLVRIRGQNLTVRGEPGSFLDGQGQLYWDGRGQWGSGNKPQFMNIVANDSVFQDITILNAPMHGITINISRNVYFSNWLINNLFGDEEFHPDGKFGHNTDGFAVKESHNVTITNCSIYNQDDCVVVGSGSNIYVSDLYCHNSHGLSISTGLSNDSIEHNTIKNLTFTNCIIERGENAIHIKTRKNGGYGNITGVVYRNITFKGNTLYGINIQQNYMNTPAGQAIDPIPRDNIPINDLTLENIHGEVNHSAVGVYINCADGACLNWKFNNVKVTGQNNNSCNFNPEGFEC